MTLNMIHAFSVQLFNTLPYLAVILIVISKLVFLSPVAKIAGEDEQCLLIVEVWSKYLPVVGCHLLIHWSCQNRYYFDFISDGFVDKRKMHLDAVLILFIIDIEHEKTLLFFQLINNFSVNLEWTKRSIILIHVGQGAAWKIFVVRGSKDENSFYIVGASDVLIGPCCSWSTEIQSSMWRYQCFDCLAFLILFGPIDVFSQFCVKLSS